MSETLVIEWLGPPRGGKTRSNEYVKRRLTSLGYKVFGISDKVKEAPLVPNQQPVLTHEIERNHWAILTIGKIILEQKRSGWDVIFVDRGALAHYASIATIIIRLGQKAGLKIKEGKENLVNLFKVTHQLLNSDISSQVKDNIEKAEEALKIADEIVRSENCFILIKVSPQTSLQRDQDLDDRTKSEIINVDHLRVMKNIYTCIEQNKIPEGKGLILNGEDNFQFNQDKIINQISLWLRQNPEKSVEPSPLKTPPLNEHPFRTPSLTVVENADLIKKLNQ